MREDQNEYTPALGYAWLNSLYDPVVRLTTREGTFKAKLLEQAGIETNYRVLDLSNYRVVVQDNAFSPRIELAYFFSRTRTVIRESYNRILMTPPIENLLLASSAEAGALSPLAVLQGQFGTQPIVPEKQHVFEGGIEQQVSRFARFSVTVYEPLVPLQLRERLFRHTRRLPAPLQRSCDSTLQVRRGIHVGYNPHACFPV